MKAPLNKIFFLLAVFFSISFYSYAGFPIKDQVVEQKNTVSEKSNTKSKKVEVKKQRKVSRFYKKLSKKIGFPADSDDEHYSDKSLLNILSFGASILTLAAIILGLGAIVAVPLSIAAVVLGFLGLHKRQRLEGLGITGLVLGGTILVLYIIIGGFIALVGGW
jgi:hypothetical protein